MPTLVDGGFYFISDAYFARFKDPSLMPNKGVDHNRPCFCSFYDAKTGLHWMIPISSKVDKYHEIADRKVQRYGFCNTILFGEVLGRERAFLIQNMFPVTMEYVDSQYIDKRSRVPVRVSRSFAVQIVRNSKSVLARQRHGAKLIFPDVQSIEKCLLE